MTAGTPHETATRAFVTALTARDPTTGKHTENVTELSLSIADHLADADEYRDLDLEMLRFAALLHDVGKIGVREAVQCKSKKLYNEHFALVLMRLETAAVAVQRDFRELPAAQQDEAELQRRLQRVEDWRQLVLAANEPTVLESGYGDRIREMADETFEDSKGNAVPLLTPAERDALCIPIGSLSDAERREIESHVQCSVDLASTIDWPPNLARVPKAIGGHHERLDGTGYPNGWAGDEVPLESRVLCTADIWDALTATYRPYTKAVPSDRAMTIMLYEVHDGHVDRCCVEALAQVVGVALPLP